MIRKLGTRDECGYIVVANDFVFVIDDLGSEEEVISSVVHRMLQMSCFASTTQVIAVCFSTFTGLTSKWQIDTLVSYDFTIKLIKESRG